MRDPDGDGLSDGKERDVYHTDPTKKVTYSITKIHQDQVVDGFHRAWEYGSDTERNLVTQSARDVRLIGSDGSARSLGSVRLTDRTDDFDFVTADDGSVAFTALDRETRSDVWFPTEEELAEDTDPWDPDDDGLTDGQEVYWITSADKSSPYEEIRWDSINDQGVFDFNTRLDTDPNDVDSDGDGYWDGWIGAWGVERPRY